MIDFASVKWDLKKTIVYEKIPNLPRQARLRQIKGKSLINLGSIQARVIRIDILNPYEEDKAKLFGYLQGTVKLDRHDSTIFHQILMTGSNTIIVPSEITKFNRLLIKPRKYHFGEFRIRLYQPKKTIELKDIDSTVQVTEQVNLANNEIVLDGLEQIVTDAVAGQLNEIILRLQNLEQ